MKSEFLIGSSSSGSGKTTLTLGLLRAFRNRGMTVQSFKCGPDYIDTKYHELASGNKAVNLDLFLSSEKHVGNLYAKYAASCDIAITEGVMGLFDGYDKAQGSSARIAEKLNIPVILILNAKSMAYTVAPVLYGLKNFNKNLTIAGVIFNHVSSESHYRFLSEACRDVGIAALGYLPKNEELIVPSRHLGLSIDRKYLFEEYADKAAAIMEKHIDLDRLLQVTQKENRDVVIANEGSRINLLEGSSHSLKTAVALDEAFNFIYHENINYLKRRGSVTFFSPLKDKKIPEADFVYLPGGYPELYLKELSKNTAMKESILRYVEQGGKLLAECGGMMYLSTCIKDSDGCEYPMVNVFKQEAGMENMKLTLGYRKFSYNGLDIKGHEFHYSSMESNLDSIARQYNAKGIPVDTKLLRYKNAIAGYTHIYWAEMDDLLDLFK